jgi:hypothetical protein
MKPNVARMSRATQLQDDDDGLVAVMGAELVAPEW